MSRKNTLAFTLIELLIVVAIIAILAAIAVPNFLEAQTRSKVSRVKSDLRSLATAIESYAVDYGNVPANEQGFTYVVKGMFMLTTPVAYMSSVDLDDPFTPASPTPVIYYDYVGGSAVVGNSYLYIAYYGPWLDNYYPGYARHGAVIHGYGPSRYRVDLEHYPGLKLWEPNTTYGWVTDTGVPVASPQWINIVYDATNGTKSFGGIGRIVGDLECEQNIGG
jgi:type II secretion system protein G